MEYCLRNNKNVQKSVGKRKKLIRTSKESHRRLSRCPLCEEIESKCTCNMQDVSSSNTADESPSSHSTDSNSKAVGRRLLRSKSSTVTDKNVSVIEVEEKTSQKSGENCLSVGDGGLLSISMKNVSLEQGNRDMSSEAEGVCVGENNVNIDSPCNKKEMSKKRNTGQWTGDNISPPASVIKEKAATMYVAKRHSICASPLKRITRLSMKSNQGAISDEVNDSCVAKSVANISTPCEKRGRRKKKSNVCGEWNNSANEVEEVNCTSEVLSYGDVSTSLVGERKIGIRRRSNASDGQDEQGMIFSEAEKGVDISEVEKDIRKLTNTSIGTSNSCEEKLNLQSTNTKLEDDACNIQLPNSPIGRRSNRKRSNSVEEKLNLQSTNTKLEKNASNIQLPNTPVGRQSNRKSSNSVEIEPNLQLLGTEVEMYDCRPNPIGKRNNPKRSNYVEGLKLHLTRVDETVDLLESKIIKSTTKTFSTDKKGDEICSPKITVTDKRSVMLSKADKELGNMENSLLICNQSTQTHSDLSSATVNILEIEKSSKLVIANSTQTETSSKSVIDHSTQTSKRSISCRSKGVQNSVNMINQVTQIFSGELMIPKENPSSEDLVPVRKTEKLPDLMILLLEQLKVEKILKQQKPILNLRSSTNQPRKCISKLTSENSEKRKQKNKQEQKVSNDNTSKRKEEEEEQKVSNDNTSKRKEKPQHVEKLTQTSDAQKVKEKCSQSKLKFLSKNSSSQEYKTPEPAPVTVNESKSRPNEAGLFSDGRDTSMSSDGSSYSRSISKQYQIQMSTFLRGLDLIEENSHSTENSGKKDVRSLTKSAMVKIIEEPKVAIKKTTLTTKDTTMANADGIRTPSPIDSELVLDRQHLKNAAKIRTSSESDRNVNCINNDSSSEAKSSGKNLHSSRYKRASLLSEKGEGNLLENDLKRRETGTVPTVGVTTSISVKGLKIRRESSEVNENVSCSDSSIKEDKNSSKKSNPSRQKRPLSLSEKGEGNPFEKDLKKSEKSRGQCVEERKSSICASLRDFKSNKSEVSHCSTSICEATTELISISKSPKINIDTYNQRKRSRKMEEKTVETEESIKNKWHHIADKSAECQPSSNNSEEVAEIKKEVEDYSYSKDDDDIISIYGESECDELFDCLDGIHQSKSFEHVDSRNCLPLPNISEIKHKEIKIDMNENQHTLSAVPPAYSSNENDTVQTISQQEFSENNVEMNIEAHEVEEVMEHLNSGTDGSEEKSNAVESTAEAFVDDDSNGNGCCMKYPDNGNVIEVPSVNCKENTAMFNPYVDESGPEKFKDDNEKEPSDYKHVNTSIQLAASCKENSLKTKLVDEYFTIPKVSVTGSDVIRKNVEIKKTLEDTTKPEDLMVNQQRLTGDENSNKDFGVNSSTGCEKGKIQSRCLLETPPFIPRTIPKAGLIPDSSLNVEIKIDNTEMDLVYPTPSVFRGICFKYMKDYCSCKRYKHKFPARCLSTFENLDSWDIYCTLRFAVYKNMKRFLREYGAQVAGILARRKEGNLLMDFLKEYRKKDMLSVHFWRSILKSIMTCGNCNEVSVCRILEYVLYIILHKLSIEDKKYYDPMVDMVTVISCSFKDSSLLCEILNCLSDGRFWFKETTLEMLLQRCLAETSGPHGHELCRVTGHILAAGNSGVPLQPKLMNLINQLIDFLRRNKQTNLAEVLESTVDGKILNTSQLQADYDNTIPKFSSEDGTCEQSGNSSEKHTISYEVQHVEPQGRNRISLKRHAAPNLKCYTPCKKSVLSPVQSESFDTANGYTSSTSPVDLKSCQYQSSVPKKTSQSSLTQDSKNQSSDYFPPERPTSASSNHSLRIDLQPPAWTPCNLDKTAENNTPSDQSNGNATMFNTTFSIPTVVSCQVQQPDFSKLSYSGKKALLTNQSFSDSCLAIIPTLSTQNLNEESISPNLKIITQRPMNLRKVVPKSIKEDKRKGYLQNITSSSHAIISSNSLNIDFSHADVSAEERSATIKHRDSTSLIQIHPQDNLDVTESMGVQSIPSSETSSNCIIKQKQSESSLPSPSSSVISLSGAHNKSHIPFEEITLEVAVSQKNWNVATMLSIFGPWLTSNELERELSQKLFKILEGDFSAAVSSMESLLNCMGSAEFIKVIEMKKYTPIKRVLGTVIFNLILKMIISDVWTEAHQLLTMANSANLSIMFSEAFIDEEISNSRRVLVLSEICFRVQEMDEAIEYLKKGRLFGATPKDWKYESLEGDLEIQVTLLSNLICRLAIGGYTETAPSTFLTVYRSQKSLLEPVDLLAHANKVIICALNGSRINYAYDVYLTLLKDLSALPKPTYRALLIALVWNNKISRAREVFKKIRHLNIYPPYKEKEVQSEILIHSHWQKEEIFIMLDNALTIMSKTLLENSRLPKCAAQDFKVNLLVKVSDPPEEIDVTWKSATGYSPEEVQDPIPNCLALTSNTFEDVHGRVVFVLEKMLCPTIQFESTIIEEELEESLALNPFSLMNHLYVRRYCGKGYCEKP